MGPRSHRPARPAPLDSTYNYGQFTGAGVRVYVLDTGVRITHSEFGSRTDVGYTPACPTGNEAACGSNWYKDGIIDENILPLAPARLLARPWAWPRERPSCR